MNNALCRWKNLCDQCGSDERVESEPSIWNAWFRILLCAKCSRKQCRTVEKILKNWGYTKEVKKAT